MELVADRFVVDGGGMAVDLATATRVVIRVQRSDPRTDASWSVQCDDLLRLRHHAIAPLLDYGPIARAERFEAWQCGPPWSGADAAAETARQAAARWLSATHMAILDARTPVHVRHGAPVVVPVLGDTVDATTSGPEPLDLAIGSRGVVAPDVAPLLALAEMFRAPAECRVHAVAVWGPSGSGKLLLARQLARLARINGFVPVSTRMLDSAAAPLWRGRSLFLIDLGGADGAQALVNAALTSPMPHVLLIAGDAEIVGIDGVALRPLTTDRLLELVRPRAMAAAIEREVRRIAEHARGWPGRFARMLSRPETTNGPRAALSRVAEQAVVYGGDERMTLPAAPKPATAWPAPGDLASLRRRVAEATRALGVGRHAAAIRNLRQAIAGFARRDCWTEAANAGLQLGGVLLKRGHVREMDAIVADLRDHAARSGSASLLAEAAVVAAETWIDRMRLEEAESILDACAVAAIEDGDLRSRAGLALARCLFWRGRYGEAFSIASRADAASKAVQMRRQRRLAKIAIARGDVSLALRLATDPLTGIDADSDVHRAAALSTAALVQLAAGDTPAAVDAAQAAIDAAKRARDPLRSVRARIVLAEAERRRGRASAAAKQTRRLARLARRLPPLLHAQLHPAEHCRTLPPLSLLIAPDPDRRAHPGLPLMDQMIAIVQACQTAEDEAVVLADVCGRVRRQLHAASVAVAVRTSDRLAILACDGPRPDLDAAQRAIDSSIVIQPHRLDDRILGAAPIQYGGATIGALAARWTLGSTTDQSHAAAVLTTTAAAAAPVVSAAVARRQRVAAATERELLGATTAIEQVRRLIERAAAAPFPVLIEGESGSGKELVARAIHRASQRRDRAFRTLNCAAIPDDLAEAELFGHVRGSFTGAVADRTGVFEEAHGGTVFLDEVGELTPRAQAKLLRVVQEGEVRRVGENLSRRVDVRIVAATNRNLRTECEAGRFRVDLLYRLDVIRISVPPLRDRPEDVAALVDHFWRETTNRINSRATLAAPTVAALARYSWPGNVRELQNVLAALAVRSARRGVVPASALPPAIGAPQGSPAWRLDEARRAFEERFIRAALARTGGHRGRAAAELGLSRQGLTKLMSRLGIS